MSHIYEGLCLKNGNVTPFCTTPIHTYTYLTVTIKNLKEKEKKETPFYTTPIHTYTYITVTMKNDVLDI